MFHSNVAAFWILNLLTSHKSITLEIWLPTSYMKPAEIPESSKECSWSSMTIPMLANWNDCMKRNHKGRETKLRRSKRCRRDILTSPLECSFVRGTVDMQLWKDCNPLAQHSTAQHSSPQPSPVFCPYIGQDSGQSYNTQVRLSNSKT